MTHEQSAINDLKDAVEHLDCAAANHGFSAHLDDLNHALAYTEAAKAKIDAMLKVLENKLR